MPRSERSALLLAGLLATAAFFVGVFPANVQMAVDRRRRPAPQKAAAIARLPLQVPLVLWARSVAKGEKGQS